VSPTEKKMRELLHRRVSRETAAELLGVGYMRFATLLKEYKIDWPKHNQAQKVILNGISDTFYGHSKRLGIDAGTLRTRYKSTKSAAAMKTVISQEVLAEFVQLRLQGLSGVVAALQLGYHYNSLHKKASDQYPNYKQLIKNLPRKRRTAAQLQATTPS